MSALCLLLLKIFLEIFEAVIEFGAENCPPLLIFIVAAFLFMYNGCLPTLGAILLVIIGIIAFAVWLMI